MKSGAKVLVGGKPDAAGPLFYRPSVVGDVTPDMSIVREEIFGPVAALVRFDTEAEAIRSPTTRRSVSPPISSARI